MMNKNLISVLSGLSGMFGWGTSDFLANDASEKVGHTKTFFWSQVAGLGLILLLILIVRPNFNFSPLLLGLSIFGGVAYGVGYLLFYKGFEVGNVSVVSALSNLNTLFVILMSFFFLHQRLSATQTPGVILLLIGAFLVAVNFSHLKKGSVSLVSGVKETILATIMFGVFFWPLNDFLVKQVNWLSVALITKSTALAVVFLIAQFWHKKPLSVDRKVKNMFPIIAAVGILEAIAVLGYAFGQEHGYSIIVAPIASSLTVVTVGLAMLFSKEKITHIQAAGIVMVITGIILTTL